MIKHKCKYVLWIHPSRFIHRHASACVSLPRGLLEDDNLRMLNHTWVFYHHLPSLVNLTDWCKVVNDYFILLLYCIIITCETLRQSFVAILRTLPTLFISIKLITEDLWFPKQQYQIMIWFKYQSSGTIWIFRYIWYTMAVLQ